MVTLTSTAGAFSSLLSDLPSERQQAFHSLQMFELGFEWNYAVPLLRLLRNRGVLAAMTLVNKKLLAKWLLTCK